MRHLLRVLLVLAVVRSGSALAEEPEAIPPNAPPFAAPSVEAPEQVPAPPAEAQNFEQQVPAEAQAPALPAGVPAGQWVYTSQYGWVWMPYAQNYTYVPDNGDPYQYVYYPSYGWQWVAAPWIFNAGPRPCWGAWGMSRFAWHAHPWFSANRSYAGYHGAYRGYPTHTYVPYRGAPAVYRSGRAGPSYLQPGNWGGGRASLAVRPSGHFGGGSGFHAASPVSHAGGGWHVGGHGGGHFGHR